MRVSVSRLSSSRIREATSIQIPGADVCAGHFSKFNNTAFAVVLVSRDFPGIVGAIRIGTIVLPCRERYWEISLRLS